MKIQNISSNQYNQQFSGLFTRKSKKADKAPKETPKQRGANKPDKTIYLNDYLLDYGTPKRVAFIKDHDYVITTVKLYDEKNKPIYSEEMTDDEAEAAEDLFRTNGVEDFVYLEDIKCALYGKPKQNPKVEGKNTIDVNKLSAKDRAAVLKILYDIEQKELSAKTHLSKPAVLDNTSDSYVMSYPTFLVRTFESDFEMDKVLNNLNISTRNAFMPDNIEKIIVSPDGTLMKIQTKEGRRAALDFNSGKRTVYDSDVDSSGFGTIMIMDKNGPVLKP